MINLENSRACKEFLSHFSKTDNAEYSVKYFKPAESYRFTGVKRIKGEPISYSVMIAEEAVEELGAGSALQSLRLRALRNFTAVYNGDLVVE